MNSTSKALLTFLVFYLCLAFIVNIPQFAVFFDNIVRVLSGQHMLYFIDEVLHYKYSQCAFQHPLFFINAYSPMHVLVGSIFQLFIPGILGLRIMNVLISVATIFLLAEMLEGLGISKKVVFPSLIALGILPMFLLTTVSANTEPLFGLLLMLAVYLYTKKKHLGCAVVASLLPLTRVEGLLALALFAGLLLRKKQFKPTLFSFAPLLVWMLFSQVFFGNLLIMFTWRYLPASLFEYTCTQPGVLAELLLSITAPFALVVALGAATKIRQVRYQLIIILTSLFILFHYWLYDITCQSSGEHLRYLSPVLPLLAIFFAAGLDKLRLWLPKYYQFIAAFCILFILSVDVTMLLSNDPVWLEPDIGIPDFINTANWLKSNLEPGQRLYLSWHAYKVFLYDGCELFSPSTYICRPYHLVTDDVACINIQSMINEEVQPGNIYVSETRDVEAHLNLTLLHTVPIFPFYIYSTE